MKNALCGIPAWMILLTALSAYSADIAAGEYGLDGPASEESAPFDLTTATDEELTAVLGTSEAERASRTILDNVDTWLENEKLERVKSVIPPFARTAETSVHIDSLLTHARECLEAGDRDGARQALQLLPEILEAAQTNAITEAQKILDQRVQQYISENRVEEMERLTRVLKAVLTDASLDESRRVRALELLRRPAKFEPTADAVFDMRCHSLVEDPSADIRWRAAYMLRESGRSEAIPFLKEAVMDNRNAATGMSGESTVRQAALEALGACGPDAAPVLVELLLSVPFETSERDTALDALAQTGNAEVALPLLLKVSQLGGEAPMLAASVALGRWVMKYDEEASALVIETLTQGLEESSESRKRSSCAGLAKTGYYHCIPMLKGLLNDPVLGTDAQSAIQAIEESLEPHRQSLGIPPEEKTMTVDDIIAALETDEISWALPALHLRSCMADSESRREIYEKLACMAIRQTALPPNDRLPFQHAMFILEFQKKHRDEAVPAVLRILASTNDLEARDQCYFALGQLGGPDAVRALKAAVLEEAPGNPIEREFHENLFTYLRACGPEAAPILLEGIEDLELNEYLLIHLILEEIAIEAALAESGRPNSAQE